MGFTLEPLLLSAMVLLTSLLSERIQHCLVLLVGYQLFKSYVKDAMDGYIEIAMAYFEFLRILP
jgi:hypothetical protein